MESCYCVVTGGTPCSRGDVIPPADVVRRFNLAYDVGGGEARLSQQTIGLQVCPYFVATKLCRAPLPAIISNPVWAGG